MTSKELDVVRRAYQPVRAPTAEELAELIALVRLLADGDCQEPGGGPDLLPCIDRKRGRARKADLCGHCHAIALLDELRLT